MNRHICSIYIENDFTKFVMGLTDDEDYKHIDCAFPKSIVLFANLSKISQYYVISKNEYRKILSFVHDDFLVRL
jgi:hypothetical protein